MNIKYEITFGIELDKNGDRLLNIDGDLASILYTAAKSFGGYSLFEHSGGYIYKDGTLSSEESMTLTILGKEADRSDVLQLADHIKYTLNQESVLLSESKINAVFI